MPNFLGVSCRHPDGMGINRSFGDVQIHPKFVKKRTLSHLLKSNDVGINFFQDRSQGTLFSFRFWVVSSPLPFHHAIHDQVVLQIESRYADFLSAQKKRKGNPRDCLDQP